MSLVDPISDMLTRIRNAYAVGRDTVSFDSSLVKISITEILKENDYVDSYKLEDGKVEVRLFYKEGQPIIKKIERVSKPGKRIYVKKDEIPTVLSGRGIAIISTSAGMMTGKAAKEAGLGGELICKVY